MKEKWVWRIFFGLLAIPVSLLLATITLLYVHILIDMIEAF
jgi:hypothetical protein